MADATPTQETTNSLRRVRWAQFAIFSLIGAALVGTAVQSFVRAGQVYEAVALGQGHGLLRALRHSLGMGPRPERARLESFLEANTDLGLRCITWLGPNDQSERVGECSLSIAQMRSAVEESRPDKLVETNGHVALADPRLPLPPLPPPPRGGPPRRWHPEHDGPPPDFRPGSRLDRPPPPEARFDGPLADLPPPRAGRDGGPPHPPRGPGHGPPPRPGRIMIEFEPVEANALRGTATTGLFTAFGAVGALIAAGFALARLSRRAESLQESAERQRQLASLGEMSAVLAHEIRNPLASLKGNAQLLTETLDPGGRDHQKAERIVREATRMETLSEDLLSLVRSSRVEPVVVDPVTIVRDAAQSLGGERFAIDSSRAPRSWRLDAARIRQVVENLMKNALDASPPDAPVEVAVAVTGGKLEIAVRDHGAGIAPGEESRIFDAFVTNRIRGTGLGLAVARRIVELHGGRISVRNRASGGAEFMVVLP